MPDINDLKELEDKIKSFGNEDKAPKDNSGADSQSTEPSLETGSDDLMDDILSDFDKGFVIDDKNGSSAAGDSLDLDELLGDTGKSPVAKEESAEDFLANLGDFGSEEKTPEMPDTNIQTPDESGIDEMDMLLKDMGSDIEVKNQKDIKESLPELDDMTALAGNFSETDNEKSDAAVFSMPQEDAGLDDLLKDMGSFAADEKKDDLASETPADFNLDAPLPDIENALNEQQDSFSDITGTVKTDDAGLADLGDLGSLLGDQKEEKEGESFEGLDIQKDTFSEEPEEVSIQDVGKALGSESVEASDLSGLDLLEDISSFEVPGNEQKGSPEQDMLELDNLDSLSVEKIEEEPEEIIEKPKVSKKKETPSFLMPEELSQDDIKKDNDEDVALSENERKQIVITLTALPKEAELKISKAIISNKYPNIELKPLINSLIDSESPVVIIKLYERLTGDKSLAKIAAAKHDGASFEEHQKSFGYLLEKNILPIVSKIAAAVVLGLAVLLVIIKLFWPTIQATNYYNKGYKKLENKAFTEVEENFEKAFKIQPRFKEALKYARGYRKYKRYIEAEKKYETASNIKPSDEKLILEYADFFRETKDFERSEKKYKNMLLTNRKNIRALLGLAKNYIDWSEVETNKINDAKETYLDVFEIEPKNREAVFGNLNIALKLKNHKDIMKHYKFIQNNFKEKIDAESYAGLASYFIDINEVDEAKLVLSEASKSVKRGQIIPEIQFQYARYKKYLGVYNEEKKHLQNVLSQFERMKKNEDPRFENKKYRELLAETYNMLGENAETASKANPDAEMYYNKAIQTYPDYGKSYFNLANFALKYKPNGFIEAKEYYLEAESKGFSSERLDYNLGWLFYKENDFDLSYRRIIKIMENNPDNSNIKFFIGTLFYKMEKYDLSESMFVELYSYFHTLSAQYMPLEADIKEDIIIMDMMKKISNNLGATYQKKYETTRKAKYLIQATNYYYISTEYFDKLVNSNFYEVDVYKEKNTALETETNKYKKEISHINVRMVLYPDAGFDEPFLYEDFPVEYKIFM